MFSAAGIKLAMRMRCVILSSVTFMAVPYRSNLFLINGIILEKKVVKHKMRVSISYKNCLKTSHILRKIQRYIVINVITDRLASSLIRYAWNLIFRDYCRMSFVGLAKIDWRTIFAELMSWWSCCDFIFSHWAPIWYKFLFADDERSTDYSHTQPIYCTFAFTE